MAGIAFESSHGVGLRHRNDAYGRGYYCFRTQSAWIGLLNFNLALKSYAFFAGHILAATGETSTVALDLHQAWL